MKRFRFVFTTLGPMTEIEKNDSHIRCLRYSPLVPSIFSPLEREKSLGAETSLRKSIPYATDHWTLRMDDQSGNLATFTTSFFSCCYSPNRNTVSKNGSIPSPPFLSRTIFRVLPENILRNDFLVPGKSANRWERMEFWSLYRKSCNLHQNRDDKFNEIEMDRFRSHWSSLKKKFF